MVSRVFDDLVRVPGTNIRFGLDPLIGLLPGGGDLIAGMVSAYALLVASRLGAPASVIARMVFNIAIDTVVGSIPLVGDAFDVAWRANHKNLELLERYERSPSTTRRSSAAVLALALLVVLLIVVGAAFISIWVVRQIIALLRH